MRKPNPEFMKPINHWEYSQKKEIERALEGSLGIRTKEEQLMQKIRWSDAYAHRFVEMAYRDAVAKTTKEAVPYQLDETLGRSLFNKALEEIRGKLKLSNRQGYSCIPDTPPLKLSLKKNQK